MTFDLTKDEDIEHAVAESVKLGTVKYLVNIAGIQHIDPVENFPMEKYDLMQRLMLRAPFYLSKLTIPHMKKSSDGTGVIGNMASVHAHICTVNKPVYNITKFGLKALSQSISAEGDGKVRSFTVSTGFVRTPLALNQIPAQAEQRGIRPEEVVQDVMMGHSRIKEMMCPIEVANLFIFGFSRFAKYLVGGDLLFDGGMAKFLPPQVGEPPEQVFCIALIPALKYSPSWHRPLYHAHGSPSRLYRSRWLRFPAGFLPRDFLFSQ